MLKKRCTVLNQSKILVSSSLTPVSYLTYLFMSHNVIIITTAPLISLKRALMTGTCDFKTKKSMSHFFAIHYTTLSKVFIVHFNCRPFWRDPLLFYNIPHPVLSRSHLKRIAWLWVVAKCSLRSQLFYCSVIKVGIVWLTCMRL